MGHTIFRKESCGTLLTIDIVADQDPTLAVQECFSVCEKFEQRYSRFIPWNWLDQININGGVPVLLDEESALLVTYLLDLAKKTWWKFDPTITNTLESYGYNNTYSFLPKKTWPVGYQHISFHDNVLTLHDGVKIEFGAIGKGYLLDVMKTILVKSGFSHFLLDFGGDMIGKGGYEVWLENPFDLTQVIGTIVVDDCALASSNGAKRAVGDFHHLLNAVSGKPVHDIAGVYITAATWMIADLWSTAIFVSWAEEGKALLENTDEITGMIVFADGSYWKKDGYKGKVY